MALENSLSTFRTEVLFQVLKLLERPDKLRLCLTCPQMLHLFASYYDLDRYRKEPLFIRKIDLSDTISRQDFRAQGSIIKYIAMPGSDNIDDPPPVLADESDEMEDDILVFGDWIASAFFEESVAGTEEAVVEEIIEEWLRCKCGLKGGVLCAECYKYIPLRRQDGRGNNWGRKQFGRQVV